MGRTPDSQLGWPPVASFSSPSGPDHRGAGHAGQRPTHHQAGLRTSLTAVALILSLLGVLAAPAAGAAPAEKSTGHVFRVADVLAHVFGGGPPPEPVGSSKLVRTDNGLSADLKTTGLTPGHVVTLWWVVFNYPDGPAASERTSRSTTTLGHWQDRDWSPPWRGRDPGPQDPRPEYPGPGVRPAPHLRRRLRRPERRTTEHAARAPRHTGTERLRRDPDQRAQPPPLERKEIAMATTTPEERA